jgi:NAD(P)H-dependent flavin oxidoreductase YrpB (nitropropane dioxygenase family)
MSEESCAHPEYKRRLLRADRTVLTDLFAFGWPARHRVIPNAATERWLRAEDRAPELIRLVHRVSAPLISRLPMGMANRMSAVQRVALPLFGPSAPIATSPDRMVEVAPLYAGETVARIDDIRPAAELVRELAA